MNKFNGYEEAKKAAQYTGGRLPAGAYVCNVMNVRYEENKNMSDVIVLQFDIAEGEQTDFFKKQYESNTSDDKKWKGTTRIYVPADDGTEKDEWSKKSFARWTNGFEQSNPGYAWDWNENGWKGKQIGIIFGDTGTVIDGKEIVYTEARTACSVDDVRNNKFWDGFLKFKAKNGYTGKPQVTEQYDGFLTASEATADEIPF